MGEFRGERATLVVREREFRAAVALAGHRSIAACARHLGVSQPRLWQVLAGAKVTPTLAARWASALNTKAEQVFGDGEAVAS